MEWPQAIICPTCNRARKRHCASSPTCSWFPCPTCHLTMIALEPLPDAKGWKFKVRRHLPGSPSESSP